MNDTFILILIGAGVLGIAWGLSTLWESQHPKERGPFRPPKTKLSARAIQNKIAKILGMNQVRISPKMLAGIKKADMPEEEPPSEHHVEQFGSATQQEDAKFMKAVEEAVATAEPCPNKKETTKVTDKHRGQMIEVRGIFGEDAKWWSREFLGIDDAGRFMCKTPGDETKVTRWYEARLLEQKVPEVNESHIGQMIYVQGSKETCNTIPKYDGKWHARELVGITPGRPEPYICEDGRNLGAVCNWPKARLIGVTRDHIGQYIEVSSPTIFDGKWHKRKLLKIDDGCGHRYVYLCDQGDGGKVPYPWELARLIKHDIKTVPQPKLGEITDDHIGQHIEVRHEGTDSEAPSSWCLRKLVKIERIGDPVYLCEQGPGNPPYPWAYGRLPKREKA